MITKKNAETINRLGRKRMLERRAEVAALVADETDEVFESPKLWRLVKTFIGSLPGSGAIRFPAGTVIEDLAVKHQLEQQGAVLRPIA